MSYYGGDWAPYVSVEERRRNAERILVGLRKTGHKVAPVTIAGRAITTTVWGRAWCENLEGYSDYQSRLPRGRSYVRNGSVVDLQIVTGRVTAMVSGSDLYKVTVSIKETAKTQWRAICRDCAGGIDTLVELLQGRFSKGVMERLCRQEGGLFPRPRDIRFSCSCQDHASLCKHVAAALYGVGARLDQQPELLFRLRAVNEGDLVAGIDTALPLSQTGRASGRALDTDDISGLFGLDMAAEMPVAAKLSNKPKTRRALPVRDAAATGIRAAIAVSAIPDIRSAVARPVEPKRSVAAKRGVAASKPKPAAQAKAKDAAKPAREPKPKPVKWW